MLGPTPSHEPPDDTQRFRHMHGHRTFRWLVGAIGPMAIVAYGLWIVSTRHATFGGRRGSITLTGTNAIAIGVAWVGVALFVHCTYFWDDLIDSHWLSDLGKIAGLILAIGGLGFMLVRFGILGIK